MSENQKQSVEGWVERFDDNCETLIESGGWLIPYEGHYMDEVKKFISNLLSQQQLEVVEMIKKSLPAYRKQERTDNLEADWYENGGFNDCLREVLQSLSTLTTLNNK